MDQTVLEEIMGFEKGFLTKKKTYITSAATILSAVLAFGLGEIEAGTMMSMVSTALLAVFLRNGVG